MKYSRENSFNCKSLTYYKYNCQNILNSENYSSSLKKKKNIPRKKDSFHSPNISSKIGRKKKFSKSQESR